MTILVLNIGEPKECVLSPMLYRHDSDCSNHSNTIVKFADNAAVAFLITEKNKETYVEEVENLTQDKRDDGVIWVGEWAASSALVSTSLRA